MSEQHQIILKNLDSFLHKNDYESAEKYLLNQLENADLSAKILIYNELMGLYRKINREEHALLSAQNAIEIIYDNKLETQVGSATTFLNAATVFKAFAHLDKSINFFEKAKKIYEEKLDKNNPLLAGLYNNMGLTLVELKRFDEANALYKKAISILISQEEKKLDIAITYLNMASALEAELGLLVADEQISNYLEKAKEILEGEEKRDGYYAFVAEKCSSVFGYYGYFLYENELKERSKRIYEGN